METLATGRDNGRARKPMLGRARLLQRIDVSREPWLRWSRKDRQRIRGRRMAVSPQSAARQAQRALHHGAAQRTALGVSSKCKPQASHNHARLASPQSKQGLQLLIKVALCYLCWTDRERFRADLRTGASHGAACRQPSAIGSRASRPCSL